MMHIARTSLIALATLLVVACGESSQKAEDETRLAGAPVKERLRSDVAHTYYAENPDFFIFAAPEDLPADLNWEDGMDLPDIGSPQAQKGGTWYTSMQDFPRTLRTVGPDSNGGFRNLLLDDVTLGFAMRHPLHSDKFYPALASEWAISREDKTVYVRINPKAAWSDGVPITADDMMFMFFFYQSAYIQAPWYNNWYGTRYINITKYDDHTFSIKMPDARPDMDSRVLTLRPQPEHFYHDIGDDFVEKYQWEFAPTTGPYIVKPDDIKKGRAVTLTRDDFWWAKDNKFLRNRWNPDRIRVTVIRDAAKSFEAFRKGELDQSGLNLSEYWYDKLPNNDVDVQGGYIHKSVFYNVRPRPMYGLYLNTAKSGLDDIHIRLGLQHAANWDAVTEKYYRGDATRMNTYWDGYGRFTNPAIIAREFSIDKALAHFAQAGYTTRGDDGILVNAEGQRLSFQLSTGYEVLKDILTILKEEAGKAGVELRLEVLDSSAGWKKVNEKKHDIMFTAFSPFNEPFPRFWEFFHSDNAYDTPFLEDGSVNPDRKLKPQASNFFSFSDPEMDAWIETYRASEDEEEMLDLTYKMQQRVHDQAIFVPGFVRPFYRVGHWRWVKYPEDFNVRASESAGEFFVHWVDNALREETLEAREKGETFPPVIKVYDQYNVEKAG